MNSKLLEIANWGFIYLSYPILSLLLLGWVISLTRCLRPKINRSHLVAALVAIVATSCIFLSHEHAFKTNSDEANLMATSRGFFELKQPVMITEAKYYFEHFYPENLETPRRALMFPYMVNVIHTIIGVRVESAFILNFVTLAVLLFFTFTVLRKRLGNTVLAYAGVFAVLSQPVINIYATSAGYDLISAVLLMLSLLFAYEYTFEGGKKDHWFALISTILVFSNIRYENPVIALVILASVFFFNRKNFQNFTSKTWMIYLCVGVFFMIPQICQRFISWNQYENPADVAAFSFQHAWENLSILVRGLFRFDLPYNNLILLLALPALAILFSRRSIRSKLVFLLLPLCAQLALYLPYYFGRFDHPSSARFFILLMIYASGFCIWAYSRWIKPAHLATLSFALMVCYLPVGIDDTFSNTLLLNRDVKYLERFAREHDENQAHRILFIYERPVQFTALGYGALSLEHAKPRLEELQKEKQRGLYDHVYLFEATHYGDEDKTWGVTSKAFKYLQRYQQAGNGVMQVYELN